LRGPYGHPYHPAHGAAHAGHRGRARGSRPTGRRRSRPRQTLGRRILLLSGDPRSRRSRGGPTPARKAARAHDEAASSRAVPAGGGRLREAARALLPPGLDSLAGPYDRDRVVQVASRLQDDPERAARALPADRARAGGAELPAEPRWHERVGADRQLGPPAELRAAARVREREPRQGDAARGVPAQDRQPSARRRRARAARVDDQGVVE
jgi:hypothetical protein